MSTDRGDSGVAQHAFVVRAAREVRHRVEQAYTTAATRRTLQAITDGFQIPVQTSITYRGFIYARRTLYRSRLYQWLTAEPDPDVIVIDLRDTWTAGPILTSLQSVISDNLQAVSTSWLTRFVIRGYTRFQQRPVRVISMGLIAVIVALFSGLGATGRLSPPFALVLAALLLLGLWGTQSSMSLADLQETRWWTLLQRAFTPPSPPENS